MFKVRLKIEEITRGSLAPSMGGAVVLETLSASPEGRPFWHDTDGGRHYETGGMLTVYVPTVRIHAFGQDSNGECHALLPVVKGELPRGLCDISQGRELAVWESGIALAQVSCDACRKALRLVGRMPKRESNGI